MSFRRGLYRFLKAQNTTKAVLTGRGGRRLLRLGLLRASGKAVRKVTK